MRVVGPRTAHGRESCRVLARAAGRPHCTLPPAYANSCVFSGRSSSNVSHAIIPLAGEDARGIRERIRAGHVGAGGNDRCVAGPFGWSSPSGEQTGLEERSTVRTRQHRSGIKQKETRRCSDSLGPWIGVAGVATTRATTTGTATTTVAIGNTTDRSVVNVM